MLGMAALKECPVIMWFSSVKSPNNCESHWFILAFVSSLPDLKLKTGLLGWNEPSLCANTLSLFMALTGQHKFFSIAKRSMILPLNPVVLLYCRYMSISLLFVNFTFSHSSVVFGSKYFSVIPTISPILQAEKKHSVQADQKTCFDNFDHSNSAIL